MQDYKDFPPCNYLLRVLKAYPRSAFLYVSLWKIKKKIIKIQKDETRRQFHISPILFRNFIGAIAYLGLATIDETDDAFKVELMGAEHEV